MGTGTISIGHGHVFAQCLFLSGTKQILNRILDDSVVILAPFSFSMSWADGVRILVAVKRVIDPYVKIRINSQQSAVETQHVKHTINPFDEIALEEAIRLLEAGVATEIVAVSIGSVLAQDTLRHALALGASRAVHIETDKAHSCLHIAKILHQISKNEQPDLILMGKQAIDDDSSQTPAMLAALLNWPQATAVSSLQFSSQHLRATQETDTGLLSVELELPAVVSVDLRLNQPRYVTLPNLMRAKQKSLIRIPIEQLGLQLAADTHVLHVASPPARATGVRVHSVDELVYKLRHEAKVLI
jgi:electron transfer flavoprotein beta subunit